MHGMILLIGLPFSIAYLFLHDEELYTLTVGVYNLKVRTEYLSDWATMFAGLVILAIPMSIVFLLFRSRIVSALTAGALK